MRRLVLPMSETFYVSCRDRDIYLRLVLFKRSLMFLKRELLVLYRGIGY